jgi:YidC/Oxa1 family membrane protein insertase
MIGGVFEVIAKPMEWVYGLTNSYILMIAVMAVFVIVLTAPLVLKSTKGMLEMQKLAPEMRRLQSEHRNDRQKLNEEMMKLYQEHKVNPLASCFPLLLQMPVFIIMWRLLHGLTDTFLCPPGENAGGRAVAACGGVTSGESGFFSNYINRSSELFQSLRGRTEMLEWGLDLSISPRQALVANFGKGLIYALLVVAMAGLYLFQQRMVASRSQASPTMSATQQKIMMYLPVVFAVFMVFYLTGLVIFYMVQAMLRIGLNYYITHRFYKGEESLGRQAQRASEQARELAKKDGGGGGFLAQAKRDLAAAKETPSSSARPTSKRVTPPKNRPTPSNRPASSGRATRPTPSGRSTDLRPSKKRK